jgi:hypothetical protein
LLRRPGTAGERDSATYQLRFLIGLLPPDRAVRHVKQALFDLLTRIEGFLEVRKGE